MSVCDPGGVIFLLSFPHQLPLKHCCFKIIINIIIVKIFIIIITLEPENMIRTSGYIWFPPKNLGKITLGAHFGDGDDGRFNFESLFKRDWELLCYLKLANHPTWWEVTVSLTDDDDNDDDDSDNNDNNDDNDDAGNDDNCNDDVSDTAVSISTSNQIISLIMDSDICVRYF